MPVIDVAACQSKHNHATVKIPRWEAATVPSSTTDGGSDLPSLDELISLSKAAELSGLSAGHLCLWLNQGKMWGRKFGRNYVTTARAAEEYLTLDRRPGPMPQESRRS